MHSGRKAGERRLHTSCRLFHLRSMYITKFGLLQSCIGGVEAYAKQCLGDGTHEIGGSTSSGKPTGTVGLGQQHLDDVDWFSPERQEARGKRQKASKAMHLQPRKVSPMPITDMSEETCTRLTLLMTADSETCRSTARWRTAIS